MFDGMKLHKKWIYVMLFILMLIPLLFSIIARIDNPNLNMMFNYLNPCFKNGAFVADPNLSDATIYYLALSDDIALFFQGPYCIVAEIAVIILAVRMKKWHFIPFAATFSALMLLLLSAWCGDYAVFGILPINYNRIMLLGCYIRNLYRWYAAFAYAIVFSTYAFFFVKDWKMSRLTAGAMKYQ